MDPLRTRHFVESVWDDTAVPELIEYLRIPNTSPAFDPKWQEHGYIEDVVARFERWARAQGP